MIFFIISPLLLMPEWQFQERNISCLFLQQWEAGEIELQSSCIEAMLTEPLLILVLSSDYKIRKKMDCENMLSIFFHHRKLIKPVHVSKPFLQSSWHCPFLQAVLSQTQLIQSLPPRSAIVSKRKVKIRLPYSQSKRHLLKILW